MKGRTGTQDLPSIQGKCSHHFGAIFDNTKYIFHRLLSPHLKNEVNDIFFLSAVALGCIRDRVLGTRAKTVGVIYQRLGLVVSS